MSLHVDQRIGDGIEIGFRDLPESRQSSVTHGPLIRLVNRRPARSRATTIHLLRLAVFRVELDRGGAAESSDPTIRRCRSAPQARSPAARLAATGRMRRARAGVHFHAAKADIWRA
jgi:hypothetical protein